MSTVSASLMMADGSRQIVVGKSCTIGRSTDNSLVLPEEKVSRRHALIHSQNDGEFWIVDLGSINGTCVNDRRIICPVRLHDQDRITIESSTFVFFQQDKTQNVGAASDMKAVSNARTVVSLRVSKIHFFIGDIIGYTRLTQTLAPHSLSRQVGGWLCGCREIVESNGGTINKYLGDGFLAFWRSGSTSENRIVQAVEKFIALRAQIPLDFRFVLHHGECAFGAPQGGAEESMMGPDVNFAFRMEKIAPKLGVRTLLSDASAQILGHHFDLRSCGSHPVAGFNGEFLFHTLSENQQPHAS